MNGKLEITRTDVWTVVQNGRWCKRTPDCITHQLIRASTRISHQFCLRQLVPEVMGTDVPKAGQPPSFIASLCFRQYGTKMILPLLVSRSREIYLHKDVLIWQTACMHELCCVASVSTAVIGIITRVSFETANFNILCTSR